MCGGSILSCCPRNPHRHDWALKEEEDKYCTEKQSKIYIALLVALLISYFLKFRSKLLSGLSYGVNLKVTLSFLLIL